jgi:DNA-binding NarL/FixJ family response regulator
VDVVLFDTFGRPDLGVGDISGLLANPAFRHVVVYTGEMSPSAVSRMLAAGASGFFSKDLPAGALVDGLQRVARGDQVLLLAPHRRARSSADWPGRLAGLTERESEVLALLAKGYRNHEIGDALFVSLDTVKTHVKAVYRKLGVRNRAGAVAVALADGSFATREAIG